MNGTKNEKSFLKTVFALALPIAAQSLITIGVNMLDTVMVSRVGENEISATSLANSFISIYQILCMGLGMGASVLVSRYWGMLKVDKSNEDAAHALRQTIALMLRFTLLFASCFAVATYFIPAKIMETYTTNEAIVSFGVEYLRYSVITYFLLGMSLVCTIVLRSVGQVMLPLGVSIGALFVNLIANYAFIFGKLGAPKMGVAGAAIGTLIARAFEATCICGYLFLYDQKIVFRIKDLFMNTGSLIKEYFLISIPVLVSDALLAVGNNAVAQVIGHLGAAFIAANAATTATQQLSTVVVQGVSQAGAIVTGQTLGSGNVEKTQKQGWQFLALGAGLGLISAVFIIGTSTPILMFYKLSDEANAIGKELMLAISIIIVFQATNSIMTKGVLRGGGDTKMLMLTDNVFLWTISIPLGLLSAFVFHLPAFWIYTYLKSDQIVKTIWCVFRLKSGKWIKKVSTGDK